MDSNALTKWEIVEFLKTADPDVILNDKDNKGTPWLDHLFSVYQDYFGETCVTCPSKIMGYIQQVKNIKKNTMSQSEKQYLLKSGAVIRVFGSTVAYSNANLTDEVAKELLKENPNRSVLFAKIPKEAKQAETEPTEKQLSKMNKTELLKKASDLKISEEETSGKSNADLVKIIEAKQAETK